jgi:hypothetical protein
MDENGLPLREKHIRDAYRWAYAIITVAFLVLTAGFVGQLSTAAITPPNNATDTRRLGNLEVWGPAKLSRE